MSLKQPARVIDVISERDPNHGGYGGMVEIEFPDGARARVAHLSKVKVKPGDVIPAKKVFALTGGAPGTPGAGRSTGPHVHLEMLTTARGRNETTKGKADPTAIAPRFYIDS
jgi:murein DD-endopeptidase MepM/ murein hydrolase activator NlpD